MSLADAMQQLLMPWPSRLRLPAVTLFVLVLSSSPLKVAVSVSCTTHIHDYSLSGDLSLQAALCTRNKLKSSAALRMGSEPDCLPHLHLHVHVLLACWCEEGLTGSSGAGQP